MSNGAIHQTLMMDEPKETQATPLAQPIVYASLWRRFAASVLDILLVTTVLAPLIWLLSVTLEALHESLAMSETHARYLTGLGTVLLWVIVNGDYEARMISSHWQATLGKMLMGIRVYDADGGRLDYLRASARHYGKYLSVFPLGAGVWAALFSPTHQTMHDHVSNTVVVRG